MVSLIVFWRLTPKKDMVCSSVLVLQCWRVPLIPPSTGRSLVRHHSRERNQEQLGRSRKDKVGRGEAAHASQRPSLLFSLPRRLSLCFSAANMIRLPISFVFLSSFLLICFGTSARGDWSFPLWPAGFCIPHSLVRQGECELELEMFSFKVLF